MNSATHFVHIFVCVDGLGLGSLHMTMYIHEKFMVGQTASDPWEQLFQLVSSYIMHELTRTSSTTVEPLTSGTGVSQWCHDFRDTMEPLHKGHTGTMKIVLIQKCPLFRGWESISIRFKVSFIDRSLLRSVLYKRSYCIHLRQRNVSCLSRCPYFRTPLLRNVTSCICYCIVNAVEPLIMDTLNKGHLSIMDTCFGLVLTHVLSCIL